MVKRGRDGAIAIGHQPDARDEKVYVVPTVVGETEDLNIVDTIGAGDNFDAGFLRGFLLDRALEDCLSLGARCAAASLGAMGGIEGQWRHNVADDGKAA